MKPTPLRLEQFRTMIVLHTTRRSTQRTSARRLLIGLATLAAITATLAAFTRS